MRILYVEDNPANVFLVQRVARIGNHEVIHYTEGQPALDNFDRDNPDLILMDVQIPGKMDGLDVVRALRARGVKTVIVAVTAYAMMGDREKCLAAGCDTYLSKPMPVQELVELLRRYDPKQEATPAVKTETVPAVAAPAETPAAPETTPVPEASATPTVTPTPSQEPSKTSAEAVVPAVVTPPPVPAAVTVPPVEKAEPQKITDSPSM